MSSNTISDPLGLSASVKPATVKPVINPWLIAITVTLATFMELLDTSIANVSLPHIAGGLAVSYDESTWVLTSYLVANAVVLPLSAWLSRVFGRKNYYMTCVALFHRKFAHVRPRSKPRLTDLFPSSARHWRRRAGSSRTSHSGRYLSSR